MFPSWQMNIGFSMHVVVFPNYYVTPSTCSVRRRVSNNTRADTTSTVERVRTSMSMSIHQRRWRRQIIVNAPKGPSDTCVNVHACECAVHALIENRFALTRPWSTRRCRRRRRRQRRKLRSHNDVGIVSTATQMCKVFAWRVTYSIRINRSVWARSGSRVRLVVMRLSRFCPPRRACARARRCMFVQVHVCLQAACN